MSPRFSCRDYARPDDKTEFTLAWCDACNFGRLAGTFTPEQVSSFYPAGYYTHSLAATWATQRRTLANRAIIHLAWRMDRSKSNFDIPSGETVCDVGCGNGNDLRRYKAAGFTTFGVDPDPNAVKAAADAGTILVGHAEALPPSLPKWVDVIHMSHVLEHCIDPTRAIVQARSRLSVGGTLIVEVPNNACADFAPAWLWTDIPRHLSFFTPSSLSALLRNNRFQPSRTDLLGFTRRFVPEWYDEELQRSNAIGVTTKPKFWTDLADSVFHTAEQKYDSVRIYATAV